MSARASLSYALSSHATTDSGRVQFVHGCNRSNAYIEEVRGDEPEIAAKLRIEERELEAGGLN